MYAYSIICNIGRYYRYVNYVLHTSYYEVEYMKYTARNDVNCMFHVYESTNALFIFNLYHMAISHKCYKHLYNYMNKNITEICVLANFVAFIFK